MTMHVVIAYVAAWALVFMGTFGPHREDPGMSVAAFLASVYVCCEWAKAMRR